MRVRSLSCAVLARDRSGRRGRGLPERRQRPDDCAAGRRPAGRRHPRVHAPREARVLDVRDAASRPLPGGGGPDRAVRDREAGLRGVPRRGPDHREGGARGDGARAGGGASTRSASTRRAPKTIAARRVAVARARDGPGHHRRVRGLRVPVLPADRAGARRALGEATRPTVRFVYKFMPLSMHPHGEIAARAAIAAQAQGKFWEMHHQLFANGAAPRATPDPREYAAAIGLDLDRFRADMQSPATKARLDADRKLGDELRREGDADDLHQRPRVRLEGRHRRVGRRRRLPVASTAR